MLIGVFKSNLKVINGLTIVIACLLWLPSFWHSNSIINYQSSLFNLIDVVKDIPILNFIVSVIFISAQGIYLNYIVNEYKLVKNNTHLIALFFVLINGLSVSFLVFNPVLLANTFVLIVLHQLFKIYNEKQTYSLSFNTGLLVAVGALIYFPIIILFPFVWFVLLYVGTPKWRDFIISIIGLFLPFIFYVSYFFIINELSVVVGLFKINNVVFNREIALDAGVSYYYVYPLITIGILSLIKLVQSIQRDVLKIRKFKMVLLALLFLFSLTIFFNENDYIAIQLLIAAPLSIFLANLFGEIKRNWLAEILFLCLLVGVVLSYFS